MVLNGSYSNYSIVESGVPQGSVFGSPMNSHLERNIKSNFKFFAEDTMLFSIVNEPAISANNLNHRLNIIHQWAQQFNPGQTKHASFIFL